jgi:hypothetical protein
MCGSYSELVSFIIQQWLVVSIVMSSCYLLRFWGCAMIDIYLDWDNGIVRWWLIISSFHDSCYLHEFFVMTIPILYLGNSLLHVLFSFRWSLQFVRFLLSISSLSMMSLLHMICWLFYYWAHPIHLSTLHKDAFVYYWAWLLLLTLQELSRWIVTLQSCLLAFPDKFLYACPV